MEPFSLITTKFWENAAALRFSRSRKVLKGKFNRMLNYRLIIKSGVTCVCMLI